MTSFTKQCTQTDNIVTYLRRRHEKLERMEVVHSRHGVNAVYLIPPAEMIKCMYIQIPGTKNV